MQTWRLQIASLLRLSTKYGSQAEATAPTNFLATYQGCLARSLKEGARRGGRGLLGVSAVHNPDGAGG